MLDRQERRSLPAHFAVNDILGNDRFSTTYRGRDCRDDADVVVKVVRAQAWMTRQENAVRCQGFRAAYDRFPALHGSSPYLREVGVYCGMPFVARDYVAGTPLRAILDSGTRLSVEGAGNLAAQVARALDGLANLGLSHGSVRPENVIVQANGAIALTDPVFRTAARTLQVAGVKTRANARQKFTSDVESLAALLFESLTGVRATRELAGTIAHSYRLPSQTSYALRRALAGGCARFASATEFAASLAPTTGEALFRAAWRPAAAAGLLAALGTAGGFAWSSQADRDSRPPATVTKIPVVTEPAIPPITLTMDDQAILRLAWRRFGAAALSQTAVVELLQLDSIQQSRIAAELARQRRSVESIVLAAAAGTRQNTGDSMAGLRRRTGQNVIGALNAAQRAAWDAAIAAESARDEPAL